MTSFEAALTEAGQQWASTGEAIARVLGSMIVELGGDREDSVTDGAAIAQRVEELSKRLDGFTFGFESEAGVHIGELDERLESLEVLISKTILPAAERTAEVLETVQAVVDDGVVESLRMLTERVSRLELLTERVSRLELYSPKS